MFLLQIDNVQMDDNWKKLFDLVGVTDVQNQTKETMEFIYDFVEKRGGIENVTREIELEKIRGPPSLPSRDLGDYLITAYNERETLLVSISWPMYVFVSICH